MGEPVIIQGGMGIGVSGWRLARAVSELGQLGVVSGTAIDGVCVRRLQLGDPAGDVRRALGQFPVPKVAQRLLARYFIRGGKPADEPFSLLPLWTAKSDEARQEVAVAAAFAEVWLAKEGHSGAVGINFLEKIQLPMLPSLYGALLAGVDYVLMGAGIPREIPGVLDRLARHEDASLRLHVEGASSNEEWRVHFSPRRVFPDSPAMLKRPKFLAIIASSTLATALQKKSTGSIEGFVIEGPTAGGHNAPPRGPLQLTESGEPVYGLRDVVDLEAIKKLGLPFWLAGGYGSRQQLEEAQKQGAAGIQVGTAFALCRESGMAEELKARLLEKVRRGKAVVFTDPLASPAGFPFKVAEMEGTLSEDKVFAERQRVCDLGYLRQPYKTPEGTLGYRCSGEAVDVFVHKGGSVEETQRRKCLCNGLMAAIGLPQRQRSGYREPPLITTGDDLVHVAQFLKPGQQSYSAADVIEALL